MRFQLMTILLPTSEVSRRVKRINGMFGVEGGGKFLDYEMRDEEALISRGGSRDRVTVNKRVTQEREDGLWKKGLFL